MKLIRQNISPKNYIMSTIAIIVCAYRIFQGMS